MGTSATVPATVRAERPTARKAVDQSGARRAARTRRVGDMGAAVAVAEAEDTTTALQQEETRSLRALQPPRAPQARLPPLARLAPLVAKEPAVVASPDEQVVCLWEHHPYRRGNTTHQQVPERRELLPERLVRMADYIGHVLPDRLGRHHRVGPRLGNGGSGRRGGHGLRRHGGRDDRCGRRRFGPRRQHALHRQRRRPRHEADELLGIELADCLKQWEKLQCAVITRKREDGVSHKNKRDWEDHTRRARE